ncbi:hypothetical protein, partial [Staphylococcus pasteuri]|uniref:hypothetical protein n=1 Tax=Staphylococcus pasteuri TaxID=45972 RepID=UPI001649A874
LDATHYLVQPPTNLLQFIPSTHTFLPPISYNQSITPIQTSHTSTLQIHPKIETASPTSIHTPITLNTTTHHLQPSQKQPLHPILQKHIFYSTLS